MSKLTTLALISFGLLFTIACKSKSIVGEWRSDLEDGKTNPDSLKQKGMFLTLRKDSTMTIDVRLGGDTSTTTSTPGWRVGGISDGTWKMLDSNKIQFLFGDGETKYPLAFKIGKLNDDSLILQSPLEFFLKFKRLN